MTHSIFNSAIERFKNQFVPVKDQHLSITLDGHICERRGDNYVAYVNGELTEILPTLVIDSIPVYLISKPLSDVKVGDIVKTTSVNAKGTTTYTYQIVTKVDEKSISSKTFGGSNRVITPAKGLIDQKQMVQVAINLFQGFGNTATSNSNFNPMMLMLLDDTKTGSFKELLPFMIMSQGNNMGFNPMMLLALSDQKDDSDIVSLMLMSSMMNGQNNSFDFTKLFTQNNAE